MSSVIDKNRPDLFDEEFIGAKYCADEIQRYDEAKQELQREPLRDFWKKDDVHNHISCLGGDDFYETNAGPICASDVHDCCRCGKVLSDETAIPMWFGVVCQDCYNIYQDMLSGAWADRMEQICDFDDVWFWSDMWTEQFYGNWSWRMEGGHY